MTYYAILASGPHDVSVRLAARGLAEAIREAGLLNREAMIGTKRHDADYYLGINLGDTPVDQRESSMAKAGAFPAGDVLDFDGIQWSLFAIA